MKILIGRGLIAGIGAVVLFTLILTFQNCGKLGDSGAPNSTGSSPSTVNAPAFTNSTRQFRKLKAFVNAGAIYVSGSTILAANSGGLALSKDGGATFTTATTANGLGDTSVMGVTMDAGGTIYASTDLGLSISKDGGTTFTNYTSANGLPNDFVLKSYVVNGVIYSLTIAGIGISTDGTTFSVWNPSGVPSSGSGAYIEDLAVDGSGHFFLPVFNAVSNLQELYVSSDGVTFTGPLISPQDTPQVAYANSGAVYFGDIGGLFSSSNGGTNWSEIFTGAANDAVNEIGGSPSDVFAVVSHFDSNSIFTGTNVYEITPLAVTVIGTPNGLSSDCSDVIATSSSVYVSCNDGLYVSP